MFKESNGPTESERREQLAAVFERANQLNLAGYQLTILENYTKAIYEKDWQNTYGQPFYGMTGVGIVGGSVIKGTSLHVYIVDIDIYVPEKRDKVFNEIMEFFGLSELYVEKSPSGGYHILFTSEGIIPQKSVFKFHAQNDAAIEKDKVEFFAGGQVLVAPSWAKTKSGTIGKYEKISEVDIFDTAVLSPEELTQFMEHLKRLSEKYHGSTFHHNHISTTEHREALLQEYHHLKALGFTCAPLTGGNKHRKILSWEKISDKDFDTNLLTGIVLKLGKQLDGSYLNCLDFDAPSDEVIEILFGYDSAKLFLEESVSGGFHILFKTKSPLDIYGNRLLPNGSGKVEVLWTEHQTVNIAPTCSYIKGYAYSGDPEYHISRRLSGSFENIGFADTIKMRASLNRLAQNRRKDTGATVKQFQTISEENKMALQYIHQYGKLDEVDRQIRLVYPNNTDLLNSLNIKHLGDPKPDYIRFFSLCADDGDNPDALLFHNLNGNKNNLWAGYSVKDHHSGEVISFSKYLSKYAPPKFDRLIQKIGFGKASIKIPIETTFTGETVEIKCDGYISEAQYLEVLYHIKEAIRSSKGKRQPRIVITAPTGIGKTSMFYRLAVQKKIRTILMLSYTSQVLQGKEAHTIPGVMEGLCESDYRVPETGSIFGTYDKTSVMYKSIVPREYDFAVVDEAHNMVNHFEFRSPAMKNLKALSDQCKAVIYMTATPDYINFKNIDLLIKISPENPSAKPGTVVKYCNDSKSILCNVITNQHNQGNIDIVYARDIKKLETIQHVISTKFPGIETHLLYADLKNDSKVYDSLSRHQMLSAEGVFQSGGILFTTNLIVDGVNICDRNIGNVYLLDPDSTTDLVQFPARFRNGYANYFIFISGNKPETPQALSRQSLVQKYYQMAFMQKRSYDNVKKICNAYGLYSTAGGNQIQLIESYDLLDEAGEIQEETILLKAQRAEALRMRWDIGYIKAYLGDYDFIIDEKDVVALSKTLISKVEIATSAASLADMKKQRIDQVIKLLQDDLVKDDLIKDYLKNKCRLFVNLKGRYSIGDHISTGKYENFLTKKECSKILFNYCTGLDLGAGDPMKMIDLNDAEIDSIRRTWNNLKTEASGHSIKKDEKSLRYSALVRWVENLKNDGDDGTITADMLTKYMVDFNGKYGNVYNTSDIRKVLMDIGDVFDVKKDSENSTYVIGNKWSLSDIRGITFN